MKNAFYKFPSIEAFKSIAIHIKKNCEYHGKPLPKVTFRGTVKLHGTNAAVVYSPSGEVYPQSRSRVLQPEKGDDNAGFGQYVLKNKEFFKEKFQAFKRETNIDISDDQSVVFYGEWCGNGIQKNVGINQLSKRFVLFAIAIANKIEPKSDGNDTVYRWIDPDIFCNFVCLRKSEENDFYVISDYGVFTKVIDFSDVANSVEEINGWVFDVEKECPVSRGMGATAENGSMIGEGIVFSGQFNGETLRFKAKGEEHKNEGKKTQKIKVAPEVHSALKAFIDEKVDEGRLDQAIEYVFTQNGKEPDRKGTGEFLSWIVNDVLKEEMDEIVASNFDIKQVKNEVSTKARIWFLQKY